MSETFEEYWNEVKPKFQMALPIEEGVAMQAWFHQQKKIDELEQKLAQVTKENELRKEALEFYADEHNWVSRNPFLADVIADSDIEQLEMLHNLSCNTGGKAARKCEEKIKRGEV